MSRKGNFVSQMSNGNEFSWSISEVSGSVEYFAEVFVISFRDFAIHWGCEARYMSMHDAVMPLFTIPANSEPTTN
jgi:hypothetical protein